MAAATGGATRPPCEGIAALADAALAWLALDRAARMLVDEQLNLLWWNSPAEALLAERRGLEIRGGVLSIADAAHQSSLRDLVRDALREPTSWCLELPEGRGWLLFRARGVGGRAPGLVGLTLALASEAHGACYDHLDTAFELTRAEHRVLKDLLAGNEAESLSILHGVSIETTRTHIRNIYAKVGVNSRESLFARVQGFRA